MTDTQDAKTSVLPDRLSDLLELAMADLASVEADPRYVVYMGDWHAPASDGTCMVCLAGAVMARHLGIDPDEEVHPEDFNDEHKLHALDALRKGWLGALRELDVSLPPGLAPQVSVTAYHEDPAQFRADMAGVVALLREHGL